MSSDADAPIHKDEVLTIARLSHLELTAEEQDRMTRELGQILAYVRKLEELELADVPPTAHVQIDRLPLRPDEPHASLPRELALREAPKVSGDGFAVPAFVEES
jgi:aspartyl-tRNA(Asn)/glutamyl-tRNA(Gln) amidotransferase subunit C